MRPGKVATIRINPKDCMATLDICRAAGVDIEGASFPSLVSLAFSSLLQTMRDNKIIPTRDGFEYTEMMAPYLGGKNDPRKHAINEVIHRAGSSIQVAGLSKPADDFAVEKLSAPPVNLEPVKPNADLQRAQRRLSELMQKKDLSETPGTGIVWSASDEDEFTKCYHIVYPEG